MTKPLSENSDVAQTEKVLRWTCESCGWSILVPMPGFAGDGVWHWQGTLNCGPLVARSAGFRALPGASLEELEATYQELNPPPPTTTGGSLMGLHVFTNEVHSDLVGSPVEVYSPPVPQFPEGSPVREVIFEVGERSDGAVGHRLVLRGTQDELRDAFRTALGYVDPASIQPAQT